MSEKIYAGDLKRLTPKKMDGTIKNVIGKQLIFLSQRTWKIKYSVEGAGRDRLCGAEGDARETLRRKDLLWTKLWKAFFYECTEEVTLSGKSTERGNLNFCALFCSPIN